MSSEESNNNNNKYEIHGIIGTPTSRRLSAVGSAYTYNRYLLYHINDEFWVESRVKIRHGPEWTFGGAVAAPAAGESTAEEVAMQSIDSSTE